MHYLLTSQNIFAVAVGSGLFTLGVLGSTLALANSAGAIVGSNRRSDDPYYNYYDYQTDAIARGNAEYAHNVKSFEKYN